MNFTWFGRRNRFKPRTRPEKPKRRVLLLLAGWRSYARRTAIASCTVAALAALTWALDRPVRVISMDGSFQRVSPRADREGRRPVGRQGLHVRGSRRHPARGRRPCRGSTRPGCSAAGRTGCTSR